MPQIASDFVRSLPSHFHGISLAFRHALDCNRLSDPILLVRLQCSSRLRRQLQCESLKSLEDLHYHVRGKLTLVTATWKVYSVKILGELFEKEACIETTGALTSGLDT